MVSGGVASGAAPRPSLSSRLEGFHGGLGRGGSPAASLGRALGIVKALATSLTWPCLTDGAGQCGPCIRVWSVLRLSVRLSACLSPTLQTRPGPYALRRFVA